MTDQGRSALAARLYRRKFGSDIQEPGLPGGYESDNAREDAAAILGEHGLFIADASKHEPYASRGEGSGSILGCSCGWIGRTHERESYFTHISEGAP